MVRYYPHRHTNDESNIPNIIFAQDDRIGEALSIIDNQLDSNAFLLGEKLSACDYFFFMLVEWSLVLEKSPMDYTNLAVYLNRLSQDSTIKAVCDFEEIDLTPFKI